MTDLIDLFPLRKIVEGMKICLRIVFIPGRVEANHGAAVANDVGGSDDLYTGVDLVI